MKKYLVNKNFLAGLVFTVFALFYLAVSIRIPSQDVASVGAGFMPRVYGGFLLAASLALLITSYRKMRREEAQEEMEAGSPDTMLRIGLAFGLIIFYAFALKPLGFILTSIILVFVLCILLTPGYVKRNYLKYLIFSVILSILTNFLFVKGLSLMLPQGILKGLF